MSDNQSLPTRPDVPGYLIAACAVAVVCLLVLRELRPPTAGASGEDRGPPTVVTEWKDLLVDRPIMGPSSAPIVILEAADFECPACRGYSKTLDSIRSRYPDDVAVRFMYFPLSYHRFAVAAARSAECADRQGRFEVIHRLLYQKQDSLGLKSWASFAKDAGIADQDAFEVCATGNDALPRVARDTILGSKIGVRATPTIFVNGWRWPYPPSLATLDSIVRDAKNVAK